MNRKGFLAGALVDFYSYVVFILVIMLFFFLFTLKSTGAENRLADDRAGIESEIQMLGYLRAPVEFSGRQSTMAELIAWSVQEGDYTLFTQKTRELMDPLNMYYAVSVYADPKSSPRHAVTKGGWVPDRHSLASGMIPNYPGKDPIHITFVYGKGHEETPEEAALAMGGP
ncbi:MAG: hypothetical protein ABH879_09365 [archaeon]